MKGPRFFDYAYVPVGYDPRRYTPDVVRCSDTSPEIWPYETSEKVGIPEVTLDTPFIKICQAFLVHPCRNGEYHFITEALRYYGDTVSVTTMMKEADALEAGSLHRVHVTEAIVQMLRFIKARFDEYPLPGWNLPSPVEFPEAKRHLDIWKERLERETRRPSQV